MPRPTPKYSITLVDKKVNYIRPTYVNGRFVTLPLYHSVRKTVRRWVKDQEIVEESFDVFPMILLKDSNGVQNIILQPNGNTQHPIGDEIYIVRGKPIEIETGPSQSLEKTGLDTVDPSQILDKIKKIYDDYVDFGDGPIAKVISLWTLGTFVFDCFPSYGFLWAHGEKGCGKTRFIRITSLLSYYGIMAAKISAPALYRTVQGTAPTVAIDEAEKLFHKTGGNADTNDDNLIQILNASYKRGGKAMIVEKTEAGMDPVQYEVYSPRCLASIRGIESTLEDRSIMIIMKMSAKRALMQRTIDETVMTPTRDDGYRFRLQRGVEIYNGYSSWDRDVVAQQHDLTGRLFEVFGPIIFLCERFKPEWMPELTAFIKNYEEDKESMNEGCLESDIALSIYHVICSKPDIAEVGGVAGWKGLVGVIDVALKLIDISPEHSDISKKSLGWALKRMGYNRAKKIGGKWYREVRGKEVLQYLDAHNIDYPIFGSVPVGTVAVTPIEQFKEEVKDDATNYP